MAEFQPDRDALDDMWDSVVGYEENAYKAGAADGKMDARSAFAEGVEAGVAKGYAVGMELGFMQAVAEEALRSKCSGSSASAAATAAEPASSGSAKGGAGVAILRQRLTRKLESIVTRCREMPNRNVSEVEEGEGGSHGVQPENGSQPSLGPGVADSMEEFEDIRALYRSCGHGQGHALPAFANASVVSYVDGDTGDAGGGKPKPVLLSGTQRTMEW